jgi:hypothetical protein
MTFDLKKFSIILVTCLIFGVMAYGMFVLPSLSQKTNAQHTQEVLEVLRKAAAQCYALEGEYPQNLEYLHEKYGVILDYGRYNYVYEPGAFSNMMPNIIVMEKE